jgi:tetratricopeptide (TPR) repeat protein
MAMGQPKEAIRYFDEAVLLDPLDTASYLDRGDAYSDLGRDVRTLSDYNEAVQIEPHKAEAYYRRGLERTGLEGFKRALEKLQEVRQ